MNWLLIFNILLLQDFIVLLPCGSRGEEAFSPPLTAFPATYDAWLAVVINNNEKYEQYITPCSAHLPRRVLWHVITFVQLFIRHLTVSTRLRE
jgi:hypothetical protein